MQDVRLGLAGCGALGGIIARALTVGIRGYRLIGISEIRAIGLPVPVMDFSALAAASDWVIEALPPDVVPELARAVLPTGKKLLLLSAAALLRFPEILSLAAPGQIHLCAGALGGIDAVRAFALRGIASAKLVSTKPPQALAAAPYAVERKLNLKGLRQSECIFTGTAAEAARGFPANTNVAATLAFACTLAGAENLFPITVEIWADPNARGNSHEIILEAAGAELRSRIFSPPAPDNPKSSPQAAYALLASLRSSASVGFQ